MMDTQKRLSLGEGTLYKIEGDEYIPLGRISDASFSTEALDNSLDSLAEAFKSFADEVSIAISTSCDYDDVINAVLSLMNLYKDEPRMVCDTRPRPPREIFPRGLCTMDKRGDIRRRLRCMKIARQ